MEKRGQGDFDIDKAVSLDRERRDILKIVEKMKNEQSTASKEMPRLMKEGKNTDTLRAEMKTLSSKIKELDVKLAAVEEDLKQVLLSIPNVPHADVPEGVDDKDNVERRRFGVATAFDFELKVYWDIGEELNILDVERAAKIAGTRFTVYKGLGARLERSVINFMLNLHTEQHGFTEILPPFMVNRDAMTGTGQLPKFEDDMFYVSAKDFFFIPIAEGAEIGRATCRERV